MKPEMEKLREKARKSEEKIAEEKRKIRELERKIKAAERKQRTRELIQIGGIAEIAGLRYLDKGVLLGLLLQGKQMLEDQETYRNLKRLGDRALRERKAKA